ncbi:hypothetical protein Lal_00036812 [Lupinus albus]|nr:hypothetical protein Lal_00036812 [Lupinus albus]
MNHHSQSSEGRHDDDDSSLSEFLASLMDFTPTIPDELVEHYLAKSGFQSPDLRLWINLERIYLQKAEVIMWEGSYLKQFKSKIDEICKLTRLVAVATQKFVAEVAGNAHQHCKARQATIPKDKRDKQQKVLITFSLDKRLVLTMEDLSKALHEYGVNVRHQEYFADSPSTGMDPATRDE